MGCKHWWKKCNWGKWEDQPQESWQYTYYHTPIPKSKFIRNSQARVCKDCGRKEIRYLN